MVKFFGNSAQTHLTKNSKFSKLALVDSKGAVNLREGGFAAPFFIPDQSGERREEEGLK